jgi:hypothetical protein
MLRGCTRALFFMVESTKSYMHITPSKSLRQKNIRRASITTKNLTVISAESAALLLPNRTTSSIPYCLGSLTKVHGKSTGSLQEAEVFTTN